MGHLSCENTRMLNQVALCSPSYAKNTKMSFHPHHLGGTHILRGIELHPAAQQHSIGIAPVSRTIEMLKGLSRELVETRMCDASS